VLAVTPVTEAFALVAREQAAQAVPVRVLVSDSPGRWQPPAHRPEGAGLGEKERRASLDEVQNDPPQPNGGALTTSSGLGAMGGQCHSVGNSSA